MDSTTIAVATVACTFVLAAVAVLGFWINFSDRVTRAEERGKAAVDHVTDVLNRQEQFVNSLAECHNRITLLVTDFGMYRETVARDYTSRDTIRDLEERLEKAIDRLGERLDRSLQQAAAAQHHN